MSKKKNSDDALYIHMNNGGLTFDVKDGGYGPEVIISTSSFGALSSEIRFHTNKATLQAIGRLFIKASRKDYSEEYCESVAIEHTGRKRITKDNHNGWYVKDPDKMDFDADEGELMIWDKEPIAKG